MYIYTKSELVSHYNHLTLSAPGSIGIAILANSFPNRLYVVVHGIKLAY